MIAAQPLILIGWVLIREPFAIKYVAMFSIAHYVMKNMLDFVSTGVTQRIYDFFFLPKLYNKV